LPERERLGKILPQDSFEKGKQKRGGGGWGGLPLGEEKRISDLRSGCGHTKKTPKGIGSKEEGLKKQKNS